MDIAWAPRRISLALRQAREIDDSMLALWRPMAVATLLFWMILSLLLGTGMFGDNLEQLNWSHSMQWGYYKHPPLPTWILGAVSMLIGQHWWLPHVLGAACLTATLLFTHAIARRLYGNRAAGFAVILIGLNQWFNWRAGVFNHNIVMLACIAGTFWAVLQAQTSERLRWWVAAGLFAGLACLSKYQAMIPLLCIIGALFWTGAARERRHWNGMVLAFTVAFAVFLPHLAWLVENNFLPLQYASRFLPEDGPDVRGRGHTLGSFLAQQLRFFSPMLMVILLAWVVGWWSARKRSQPELDESLATRTAQTQLVPSQFGALNARRWMICLVVFPISIVLSLGLAGVRLQNHWGLQTLQFACIPLGYWLARRLRAPSPRQFLLVALLAQVVTAGFMLAETRSARTDGWDGRSDMNYPSRLLVEPTLSAWRSVTSCPLRYVVGPSFEAGIVAAFSGQNPQVFEDANLIKSPWIDPAEVDDFGAIHLSADPDDLPVDTDVHGEVVLTTLQNPRRLGKIYWAIDAPDEDCRPNAH